MVQPHCKYVGEVVLYPMGSCSTSMFVVGVEGDLTVQLGWDAETGIKPGSTCHLYRFGRRVFVSRDKISEKSAKDRADAVMGAALEKAASAK